MVIWSRDQRRIQRIKRRSQPRSAAHRRLRIGGDVVKFVGAIVVVWNLISFASYVSTENGDTVSQRMATWGRNHHLASTIDWLEVHVYNDPPSKEPAKALALNSPTLEPVVTTLTTTIPPGATVIEQPDTAATATTIPPSVASAAAGPTTGAPTTAAPTTAAPTTAVPAPDTVPAPAAPAALAPVFTPPLAGEGQWAPIARAGGVDTMWATSIRPLPAAGGVVASMVVIDQTHVRAGLFNGGEEPGGTWKRGNRVPKDLQPALLAAFNGGFRFEHTKGGYKTEGVELMPLRTGGATLAVGTDGRVRVGQLGRDLFDDGSWISLRQNLILIVDNSQSQVQRGIDQGVWWGADYGREVYVPRSAACEMADGRLAYALVGKVNAAQLAESLINIGCVKAIQLDINGTWPVFFTFGPDSGGNLIGRFVDTRMGGNPYRYLNGSTKEFFAFFDSSLVAPASVLDG